MREKSTGGVTTATGSTLRSTGNQRVITMNKQDRKQISELITQVEELRDQINYLAETERQKYENLPEGLQMSDRGQGFEECATALAEAASEMDDAITALEQLV